MLHCGCCDDDDDDVAVWAAIKSNSNEMNPMKNGRVFAKKCLVRFLSANHLTIEACTWARQSNKQQKQHGPKKKGGREGKRGRWRKPQDVSINQKAKASSTKNSSKGEPSGEREHKKSFLIPKVSSVSASSMEAISRRCLLVTKSKREPGQYHWQGTRGYSSCSGRATLSRLAFTRGYA